MLRSPLERRRRAGSADAFTTSESDTAMKRAVYVTAGGTHTLALVTNTSSARFHDMAQAARAQLLKK